MVVLVASQFMANEKVFLFEKYIISYLGTRMLFIHRASIPFSFPFVRLKFRVFCFASTMYRYLINSISNGCTLFFRQGNSHIRYLRILFHFGANEKLTLCELNYLFKNVKQCNRPIYWRCA